MHSPSSNARSARCLSLAVFLASVLLLLPGVVRAVNEAAAEALPHNLDHSLRQLVAWHRAQPGNLSAPERRARLAKNLPARSSRVQTNADATRAVVDVTLDGSVPLAAVRKDLTDLGAEVFAEYDAHRTGSVLSTRLPLDQAEAAARMPGVYSIQLVHRAWRRVGLTTSQGAKVLKTNRVNKQLHFDGTGITVGVLSDSFDARQVVEDGKSEGYVYATSAADDAMNDDLPGFGNPAGHPEPVHVITEAFPGDDYQLNEGRAMLQIVHDLAPGAKLAFQRAGETAAELAANITKLRTQTTAPCDVIVDDFGFPDEPFFSDGPAALAARDASSNLLVAGKPVVYVSSAGNEGDVAYSADFTFVSDADARSGEGTGNLKFGNVPTYLTAGGFHNFNPKAGKVTLAQKVELYGSAEASFQWDDPFIPGKITADYNLLVFDAQGNYLPDLSGTDDNAALGKPLEIVDLPLGEGNDSITYQFAITRRSVAAGAARHLCYVLQGGAPIVKFLGYNHATTHGHNAGPGVIGVAAYAYDQLAEPETFSALGPVTIYFDSLGNRLATPEVRRQPAVAAVDGVNTSFFPPGPLKLADGTPNTDTDGDGFPNFFGTSAAAPHVAAVAALLLQAGGGPGSLTPAQVLGYLQSTALPHDLDPNFVSAMLSPPDGSTVTLSATGDESNAASGDKNGFHLAFDGTADRFLSKVVIDLGSTGLKFDPSADLGFAFTTGTKVGLKPTDVTGTLDAANTTLTLSFVPGAFTAGKSLNFGVDRDLLTTSTDGNSADLLTGAVVKVRTKGETGGNGKAQGALASQLGTGYSPAAGYGLVDAQAAVKALLANPSPSTSPAGLTSGNLLVTFNDNRVFEARTDGSFVRVFTVPVPESSGLSSSHAQEAVTDANGNIVVLNGGIYYPYLTTINPRTGTSSSVTAPGWNESRSKGAATTLSGEIVPIGRFIFTNYGQADPQNPLGLLLRFDIDTGSVRAFGEKGTNSSKSYTSLSVGPDGMLYAMVFLSGISTQPTPVDVYDPNTLALVRTVLLHFETPGLTLFTAADRIAVGPLGEIYALPGYPSDPSLYKFDPNGTKLGTLNTRIGGQNDYYPRVNLNANAQGAVAIGAIEPLLISPDFQTISTLNFSGNTQNASVTFIP